MSSGIRISFCVFASVYLVYAGDSGVNGTTETEVGRHGEDLAIDVGPFFKYNRTRDGGIRQHSIQIPFLGLLHLGGRNGTDEALNFTAASDNATGQTELFLEDQEYLIMNFTDDNVASNDLNRTEVMDKKSTNDKEDRLFGLEDPKSFKASRRCPSVNGESGFLFAHPHSAWNFYACDHGVAYLFECPEPLIFNSVLQVCDWQPTEL